TLPRRDLSQRSQLFPKEPIMSVNVLYRTAATATGGRDGRAATKDGSFEVKLSTPKELGGGGGPRNNPEQRFASRYAARFLCPRGSAACSRGAMKFGASQGGPRARADRAATANVGIGPRSEGGFGLDVQLDISLPGMARAEAQALVDKAHHVCPYSNATRNN